MSVFKATFFLNMFQNGWTETWGINTSNPSDAADAAGILAGPLMECRSTDCELAGYRISFASYPTPRITVTRGGFITGSRPGSGVPVQGPEPAQVAALARFNYGTGQSRGVLLRGIADDDVFRDTLSGAPVFGPGFSTDFFDFRAALIAGNWGFIQPDPTNAQFFVQTFTEDPTMPTRWNIGVSPLSTLPAVGDAVQFRGVNRKNAPWLTGKFTVRAVTGGGSPSFAIDLPPGVQPAVGTTVDVSRMTYQVYAPLVATVTGASLADWRTRKTGRPTNLTRGRARGIRYRR